MCKDCISPQQAARNRWELEQDHPSTPYVKETAPGAAHIKNDSLRAKFDETYHMSKNKTLFDS